MAISVNGKKLFMFWALLSGIFFYAPEAHAAIVKPANSLGLTGYWNLDEGKGITAYSHGSATSTGNGTLSGSPTWRAGKLGQALTFGASNNYVSTLVAWPTSGSISMWVYPTAYLDWISPAGWKIDPNVSGNGFVLIDEGGAGSPGRWRAVFRPNTGGASEVNVTALQNITQNTWQHVAMTWSLSGTTYTIHLYVNGIDQGVTTWTGTLSSGVGSFNFGKSGDYADNYFKGGVDDVRVYNRALPASEAAALYNRTAGTRYSSSVQSGGNGSTLNNGLVGRWTFDGADVTDKVYDRVGGNNGYFYNAATSSVKSQGKLGQGLRFSTSTAQQVVIGTAPPALTFAYNQPFSISLWARPSAYMGASTFARMASIAASSNKFEYFIIASNSRFIFNVGKNGVGDNSVTSSAFTIGQWYHLVAIYDGTNLNLYINGVSAGTATYTFGALSSPDGLFSLGGAGSTGNGFNGSLDDVRIYNRALDASEINQLYGQGGGKVNASAVTLQSGTGLDTGLAGYWSFNGPDVTDKIYDRVGGNHMYFRGMATSSAKVQGILGQAAQFTGANKYVTGTVVSNASTYAISTWFKYQGPLPVAAIKVAVSYGSGSGGNTIWMGYASDGKLAVSNSSVDVKSTISADAKWHHLVASVSGGTLSVYADGVFVGSTSITARASDTLVLGDYTGLIGTFPFIGILDETRLYSRALTATEVKSLYNLGK